MDFIAGISAATKAIEFAKTIKDIDESFGQAELKAKAAELMSTLADVKMSLVEARAENDRQTETIEKLRAAFRLKTECARSNGFSYEKGRDGQLIGCPFCPRCETVEGLMIKTVVEKGVRSYCPQCKIHITLDALPTMDKSFHETRHPKPFDPQDFRRAHVVEAGLAA